MSRMVKYEDVIEGMLVAAVYRNGATVAQIAAKSRWSECRIRRWLKRVDPLYPRKRT